MGEAVDGFEEAVDGFEEAVDGVGRSRRRG
jgi:hypothetical protein